MIKPSVPFSYRHLLREQTKGIADSSIQKHFIIPPWVINNRSVLENVFEPDVYIAL